MAHKGRHRSGARGASLLGLLAALAVLCVGSSNASAQFARGAQPITYHGGPVLSPQIACLMWSPNDSTGFSQTDVNNLQTYLWGVMAFLSELDTDGRGSNTGWGLEPAIRQYGVWGAYFPGSCAIDHNHIPSVIPYSGAGFPIIQNEITYAQQNLGLAGFDSETVVLVFTKGIPYDSNYGQHSCAFHNNFGQNNYFGLVPYPTTTGCAGNSAWGLLQTYASHELFEASTNPMGTSWYANGDPLKDGGEIGDLCPGVNIQLPANNGWVEMSQVTEDVSGLCQLNAPEQIMGMAAAKTGTNTINLITAEGPYGVRHYTGDGTSAWTQEAFLGGVITDRPAVISPDGTSLDVFGRGTDGALYRNFFDGASWSGWQWLGGYWIGPPAVAYRSSVGEYVFTRGYDGNIYYYQSDSNNNINWVGQLGLGPNATVRAVTPPQTFAVDSDCFDLVVNGSDGNIWVDAMCGNNITLPVVQAASAGPQLVSAFSHNRSIFDVIVNQPIIGDLEIFPVGGLGGQVPYELFLQNGVTTSVSVSSSFVGPTSAVGLSGQSGLWVGRAPGYPTSYPVYATAGDSVHWSQFNVLDGNVAMSGAPYVFSPDGVTADVFMTGTNGALQHKRFNGSSWQLTQQVGTTVQ